MESKIVTKVARKKNRPIETGRVMYAVTPAFIIQTGNSCHYTSQANRAHNLPEGCLPQIHS
jgi:hypothetical protein